MVESCNFCEISLESFQQITKKPTYFLEGKDDLCEIIKDNLKKTYDFTKNEEIKTVKTDALPELIVNNFSLEQIWQEIELQNNPLLTRSIITVSKLVTGKSGLIFKNLENNIQNVKEDEGSSDVLEENENNEQNENSSTSDEDLSCEENSDDMVDNRPLKKMKPSIVDDEFFKLEEMELFLNNEEKKLNDPDSGNDSEDSDAESEGSIDLFKAADDDDEDQMRTAKYKDFFVSQEDMRKKPRKRPLEEFEESNEEPKSSFEQRQERLIKKIEEIEDEAIQDKPWQLKGEVTGETRPHNSLLEEIVEFDLTSRPPPIITEQTTMQLEDVIKQRIKDKVFDSVERKTKPVETPLEYKKKLVLDQEKSKESLAQIYEKEYLDQQAALDPDNADKEEKEPELHQEINSMMKSLFTKLDALSNFHFTPKPAVPELKIISNIPAINMEEVAPIAVSDAALLAPEEVKAKRKGDIIGKAERTTTDKKRERRKKKLKQKIHVKQKQKKEKSLKTIKPGLGNKYSKEKIQKTLEKVTKEKNVDAMDESMGGKGVRSSKAFFTQLQDQVQSQIKRKVKDIKHVNSKKVISAKKLKL